MEKAHVLGNIPRQGPVHVVGAGFSGLACSYYLKKNNIPFVLYEKESRTGGLLHTKNTPYGPVETAANGMVWSKEIAELCGTLNISLVSPDQAAAQRYVVRNGKLSQLPLNPYELLRTIAKSYLSKPAGEINTVEEFGLHYLGPAATKYVLAPGIAGIYAASPNELSFEGTMPDVFKMHQLPGRFLSKLRAYIREDRKSNPNAVKGTHSFEGGMQSLINAMSDYVRENISNETITTIEELPGNVIICTPAYEATKILASKPEISKLLNDISYVPLVTVTIFYEEGSFAKLKRGFGCLIPVEEGFTAMGILFNHDIFNGRVKEPAVYSLTFILKPGKLPAGIDSTDPDILRACRNDADKMFKEKKAPVAHFITRWQNALPMYSVKHLQIIREIDSLLKSSLPHITLFGNYTGQISLRGLLRTAGQIFNN